MIFLLTSALFFVGGGLSFTAYKVLIQGDVDSRSAKILGVLMIIGGVGMLLGLLVQCLAIIQGPVALMNSMAGIADWIEANEVFAIAVSAFFLCLVVSALAMKFFDSLSAKELAVLNSLILLSMSAVILLD